MNYEQALQRWGAAKLEEVGRGAVDPSTVQVRMEFDAGYDGCTTCATGPSADVEITGNLIKPGRYASTTAYRSISIEEFDFATVLGELVDIADGAVTR